LDLLIAGTVLFLLFVATYSKRSTWVLLGSTALSIVLIAAVVFLSTADKSNPVRDGLAGLAAKLPSGWDRRTLDLANAIEQVSVASAAARKRATERATEPVLANSVSSIADWSDWTSEPPPAVKAEAKPQPAANAIASITEWFDWTSEPAQETVEDISVQETDEDISAEIDLGPAPRAETAPRAEPVPAAASDAPIKWLLDAPSPSTNNAFAVSGANVSDEPLKVLRAVLKPDSGTGKLALTVEVEGHDGADGAVVPPGARFSLKTDALTASEATQIGGAILSVAYVQAGRRKTSIMYLTPPMLAARTTSAAAH